MGSMEDERRLRLWVRLIGFGVLVTTIAVATLIVFIVPIFNEDYRVESGTVIGLIGTLSASALALVEVTVRLRRNGYAEGKEKGKDEDAE